MEVFSKIFVNAPGQVSSVKYMKKGMNMKIPIRNGHRILFMRSLISRFMPFLCKTSSAKKPARSMNNCILKKWIPLTAKVLTESLLCSPPIQWKELLSQKNMEICKTTPRIMATALTKSNPWYRSCLSTLIQFPVSEVFEAVENRPVSVILSLQVCSFFF